MTIPDKAVEAAAKAIEEVAHTRDFRMMAEAALRSTSSHGSPAVRVALEKLEAYRSWSRDGFAYPEAREYTEAVGNLGKSELAEFLELASFKERPTRVRRRKGAQIIPQEEAPVYPPDPYWGPDDKGRFHYVDYDCESLVFRFEEDGDLWVDKRGEGPVYVRKEDIPVLVNALNRLFTDSESSGAPEHSMHAEGEYFYACEACSGLPDGDRQ